MKQKEHLAGSVVTNLQKLYPKCLSHCTHCLQSGASQELKVNSVYFPNSKGVQLKAGDTWYCRVMVANAGSVYFLMNDVSVPTSFPTLFPVPTLKTVSTDLYAVKNWLPVCI